MASPQILQRLDKKFRKQYKKEFGHDAFKPGYATYTKEEQIERYAKNILFWLKQRERYGNINKFKDPYIMNGFMMCSQNYTNLYEKCENLGILNEVSERIQHFKAFEELSDQNKILFI